jgi:secondary thiamine-phosphate synthase enzyme
LSLTEFSIRTNKKIDVIDITNEVGNRIDRNAKAVLVFAPHATAALTLGEYEPNIKEDMEKFCEKLASGNWQHNKIDDNAEAHLMSVLIKQSLLVPVENGKLILGTWQRILFIELDGPRTRRIIVQTL